MKSVDVEEADDRCHTAENADDKHKYHRQLVSGTHVGFADNQDWKRHKDPVGQGVHDSVDVIQWSKNAPSYAFPLYLVQKVIRRISALEHSDKEEAEREDGEDDAADDDDSALPLFQNLVFVLVRPAKVREQKSLQFARRTRPARVSVPRW